MTTTPPLSDSWVDLSGQLSSSPNRVTPIPFGGEMDYIRMLREAQRESNRSSNRVSPISSALMSLSSTCKNTPSHSPKSPPNSPNPELEDCFDELKGAYINPIKEDEALGNGDHNPVSDLFWDWSNRSVHSKEWKLNCGSSERSRKSSSSSKPSIPSAKSKKTYSKKIIYTIFLTNVLSFILGAGLGLWLSRKHGSVSIGI